MYEVVFTEELISKMEKFKKHNRPLLRFFELAVAELKKLDDPRSRGKALKGRLAGLWRYRIGDYRLVCDIDDKVLTIVAFEFDHRSKVYELPSLLRYQRGKQRRR